MIRLGPRPLVTLGMVIAPSINTGTFGVAPEDAGVASASVNTGQQLGGSIGTSLLNTVAASATAASLTAPVSARTLVGGKPGALLTTQARCAGTPRVLVGGGELRVRAIVAAVLFRWGPLSRQSQPAPVAAASQRPGGPG